MDSLDDDKPRRNLLVVACVLTVVELSGVKLSGASVLGATVTMTRPEVLKPLMWLVWLYVLWRYRATSAIGGLGAFRNAVENAISYGPTIEKFLEEKDLGADSPGRGGGYNRALFRRSFSFKQYSTGEAPREIGPRHKLPYFKMFVPEVVASIWQMTNAPDFVENHFPYYVAAVPVVLVAVPLIFTVGERTSRWLFG